QRGPWPTQAPSPSPPLSGAGRAASKLRSRPGQPPWGVIGTLLTPALFVYAGFTAYPVGRTFYNSVHLIKPGGVEQFVGLQNYAQLLSSDLPCWRAVVKTMVWAGVATLL